MFKRVFIISWITDKFEIEVERFIYPDEACSKLKWLRTNGIKVLRDLRGKYVTRDIVPIDNLLEV